MSHFPLLVIGPDHEGLLHPFDENRAVTPYLESAEWEAALQEARAHYNDPKAQKEIMPDHEPLDPAGWDDQQYLDAYYGPGYWTATMGAAKGFEHWSTYNPDSKWDWYEVGGRWAGLLRTRDGRDVNQCTAGELDLDMLAERPLPHAYLLDGKWHEQGRMGWFGVVLDQKDEQWWAGEVRAALMGLDPATELTLIDCHI